MKSGSVSSNAVAWHGDKRGSSSSLDGELKTQRQDHNFSVTVLQKLCRIKIFRKLEKGTSHGLLNEWNLYCVPRSCAFRFFSFHT